MCIHIYIYIYIYIYVFGGPEPSAVDQHLHHSWQATANLRTRILDFGGLDSIGILILEGGSVLSIGNLPERLSQAICRDNLSREIGRTSESSSIGPVLYYYYSTSIRLLYY